MEQEIAEFPNFQKIKGQPRELNRRFRNEFPETSVPFDFEPDFPKILVEWNAPFVSVSHVSGSIWSTLGVGQREVFLSIRLDYSCKIARPFKASSIFPVLGMHVYMIKSKLKLQWTTKVLGHLVVKFDFWASWSYFLPFPPKQYRFFYFFNCTDHSAITTLN